MNPKDVKEIIKAVELLRKSGSLDKFIENVEIDYSDKGLDHPFTTEGYDSIKFQCNIAIGMAAKGLSQEASRLKYYTTYLDNLYKGYKDSEYEITNPEILQFMKDYEKDKEANGR